MRILVDIGHPAHVHYFKNFIHVMKAHNHKILVLARDRGPIKQLLDSEDIQYVCRGKGGKSLWRKALYSVKALAITSYYTIFFRPDVLMGHGLIYGVVVAKIFGKKSIATSDSDHAVKMAKFVSKLSYIFLNPSCYLPKYPNQHKFDSYMELLYLHPDFYTPKKNNGSFAYSEDKKLCLLRFVSWDAYHDKGEGGFSRNEKIDLVKKLSEYCHVIISSEGELPEELKRFEFKNHPNEIHDLLYACDLFIGESATMASECAVLGTPAIYVNSLQVGYLNEEDENYSLVYNFRNSYGVIEKALELVKDEELKENCKLNHQRLMREKISPTPFFVWLVEHLEDFKSGRVKYSKAQNNK